MDTIKRLEAEINELKKELVMKKKQLFEARMQRVEAVTPSKLMVTGDVSLKELPIKTLTLHGLLRNGYCKLDDLNGVNKETLMLCSNVGELGVIDLFETLSELGITIRDETIIF